MGNLSFFGAGGDPFSITACDIDGDGDLDLVTADNDSHTLSILLNTTR